MNSPIERSRQTDSGKDPQPTAGQASRSDAFSFVQRLASDLSGGKFELPPFPDITLRVRAALDDPEVSVDTVQRVVLSEPVLVARLLRIANSPMMRRGGGEVTDLKIAISRLGFEMVRNVAVSHALGMTFRLPGGGPLRAHIENTRHQSVSVGVLAYMLARRLARDSVKPEDAMLAGLLHAIGRFYILTRVDAFPALFGHADMLNELITRWHSGVGRAIVESWGFPEQIAIAVDEHEVLAREHAGAADVADVVVAAHLLAKRVGTDQDAAVDLRAVPACLKLRLNEEVASEVLHEAANEIRSMSQALGTG